MVDSDVIKQYYDHSPEVLKHVYVEKNMEGTREEKELTSDR